MSAPEVDPYQQILIDNMDAFRAIDNPMRQRICHLARHPRSVKDIADALGVPVTRLYYHVNMLEEHGFLKVVEVRKSGAQLERIYQSAGGLIAPSPDFVKSIGDTKKAAHILAGALFDNTRVEVESVLERNLNNENSIGSVARSVMAVPVEVARIFAARVEALAEELRQEAREQQDSGAETDLYSLTYAFVPAQTP